jgi:hypothetical protein
MQFDVKYDRVVKLLQDITKFVSIANHEKKKFSAVEKNKKIKISLTRRPPLCPLPVCLGTTNVPTSSRNWK